MLTPCRPYDRGTKRDERGNNEGSLTTVSGFHKCLSFLATGEVPTTLPRGSLDISYMVLFRVHWGGCPRVRPTGNARPTRVERDWPLDAIPGAVAGAAGFVKFPDFRAA